MRLIDRLSKIVSDRLHQYYAPLTLPLSPFTFTVNRIGRDEYQYIEGDKFLVFYAELLTGPVQLDLGMESIQKWLSPHEQETIAEAQRERIFQNICAYFDRNGITYQTE